YLESDSDEEDGICYVIFVKEEGSSKSILCVCKSERKVYKRLEDLYREKLISPYTEKFLKRSKKKGQKLSEDEAEKLAKEKLSKMDFDQLEKRMPETFYSYFEIHNIY